ncbi:MAG: pilin [Wenzhouxiangellaceae bacterium]|nr:MAG: pilin [Wenzhouxiangellaceae bacterium]
MRRESSVSRLSNSAVAQARPWRACVFSSPGAHRRACGFTLIELMIVVAIIAVLATLGFVIYQDFTIRSQVTAGLADIAAGRSNFESLVIARNLNTFDVNDLGLSAQTPRCDPIDMQPGPDGFIRCSLVGHPAIAGEAVTLQRTVDDAWVCEAGGVAPRHRPEGCQ